MMTDIDYINYLEDYAKITKLDIDTYFGDRFMPPLKEQAFYFGKSFEPDYKTQLYAPTRPYTWYGIPALGQTTPGASFNGDLFKNLANVGLQIYANSERQKARKEELKAQIELERIRQQAFVAAAQAGGSPIISASGPSATIILAGTAFIAVIGGLMYFLTQK